MTSAPFRSSSATARLASRVSSTASRRAARVSSRVAPWVFAPGSSSTNLGYLAIDGRHLQIHQRIYAKYGCCPRSLYAASGQGKRSELPMLRSSAFAYAMRLAL